MISIVLPSYNQKEFLAEAIESCLNQKYDYDYEIIIVDDGSTDGSFEIARKYAEENPVKIQLILQVNKGLANARNTGIMNATGNWILPLDADDKLNENCITKIEEAIMKDPKADVIGLSFKTFGLGVQDVVLMSDPKLEDFFQGNRIGYCSAIRKSALLEVGGYNPRMIWGYEDLHLSINLLARGYKVITIPDMVWEYRIKSDSMLTEARKHHKELLDIINKDFGTELNYPA